MMRRLGEQAVAQILVALLGPGQTVDLAVIQLLAVLLEKILMRVARITADVAGSARRNTPNALDVALALGSLTPSFAKLGESRKGAMVIMEDGKKAIEAMRIGSLWPCFPRSPALPMRPEGLPLPFYDHMPPLPPPHAYRHTELRYRREEERWSVAMRRARQQQQLEQALFRLLQLEGGVDYEDK